MNPYKVKIIHPSLKTSFYFYELFNLKKWYDEDEDHILFSTKCPKNGCRMDKMILSKKIFDEAEINIWDEDNNKISIEEMFKIRQWD